MGTAHVAVFCVFAVIAEAAVTLKADRPSHRAAVSEQVDLKCCFTTDGTKVDWKWIVRINTHNVSRGPNVVAASHGVSWRMDKVTSCGVLTFMSVQLGDSGLYQCVLNGTSIHLLTHGTYLQVYEPVQKMVRLSENAKNKILAVEGILLLLCVLLPSAALLFKSKSMNEAEKMKMKREEENIYQGLDLDKCCSAYDQIEQTHTYGGPYEDVDSGIKDEEDIELENP